MSNQNPWAPPGPQQTQQGQQVPQGYGYPVAEPGWGAMAGPLIPNPAALVSRDPAMVVILMFFTCGLYGYYWFYQTSVELRDALQDRSIDPTIDLVLMVLTCGVWGMFLEYRNVQLVHRALIRVEPTRLDQTNTVLILNLAKFFVGVTGLIATYITQQEISRLADAANRRG